MCGHCIDALPRIEHACDRCAIPLALPAVLCGDCLRRERAFDDALAVYEYRFPVDRMVLRFKYAGDLALGRWLATRLAASVAHREHPAIVVAVPLSHRALRKRGFNQAAELAKVVARCVGARCELDGLAKVRETSTQQGLDRRRRMGNLRGAFHCRLRLASEHVAIVDDVVTTGATADTLARLLKRAGAGRVSLWAVARTPDPALR